MSQSSTVADLSPRLGPRTRVIAQAIGRRIIPEGGLLPYAFDDTGALDFLERYLVGMGSAGLGLQALLWVFDLLPVLFIGVPRRFVNLSPEDQDRYLINWQENRIYYRRMVVVLLKTLCGMGFYNDPRVLKAIGYYTKCKGAEER